MEAASLSIRLRFAATLAPLPIIVSTPLRPHTCPPARPRTHACTHARTHARTHGTVSRDPANLRLPASLPRHRRWWGAWGAWGAGGAQARGEALAQRRVRPGEGKAG